MRSSGFLIFGLVIILFTCSLKKGNSTSLTFLRTSGHYMVNEKNDTILLKGLGLGNWLLTEGYMWRFGESGDRPRKIEKIVEDLTSPEFSANFWTQFRKNFITEADIRRMKELGYNSVRPALNARIFLTEGDSAVFIEENFKLLDSLISWCGKYDLYVILDMHGAPGGQTGQNIDDSPNNEPELFMNPKFEHRLFRLWMKLADRYKDNPVVAGYDLLNEPLPERTGAAAKFKHLLEPMYKNLTSEIRKTDKRHMIILEGCNWSNDWSVFTKPFDDNLVYQFHYYCWNEPDNLNDISYFLHERDRLNAPVWVGETGEKNPSIYWATTQLFEKNNIGWSFWPWKKIENSQVIYSIKAPEEYIKIIKYSHTGEKPSKELAEQIFTQLLENTKIENCNYLGHINNALFHLVPGHIDAVNYGHDGYGISYMVSDTSVKADCYRTLEPVKIVLLAENDPKSRASTQAVRLTEKEWTVYTANSLEDMHCSVTLNAMAEVIGTTISITINGNEQVLALSGTSFEILMIDNQEFVKGKNTIKVEMKNGKALLAFLKIEKK
jgi:endoglucanase